MKRVSEIPFDKLYTGMKVCWAPQICAFSLQKPIPGKIISAQAVQNYNIGMNTNEEVVVTRLEKYTDQVVIELDNGQIIVRDHEQFHDLYLQSE